MVVESLLFCLREGAPREGLSYIDFLSTSGIHPPPSAPPFSKGLLASDYLTFAFAPLRESILRLRRAPSLRGYPLRVISLSLSHRFEDPSCAFGAPLLQGATHFGLSLFLFHTAARIHPAPLARPFSKGLLASDYLSFAPLRGSILRLRRAPSLRGYSLRIISLSLSHHFENPSSAFGAPLL